jgi:YHS domain-containing protein
MTKDPVCLTPVDENETEFTTEYRGQTYYFCCDYCKEEFDADPGAYAGSLAQDIYGDLDYSEPGGG